MSFYFRTGGGGGGDTRVVLLTYGLILPAANTSKAFDYVNREALFTIFKKAGCPPILLDLIKSFHENMQSTAQVDGMISEPFHIVNGVKQGCVLAKTTTSHVCEALYADDAVFCSHSEEQLQSITDCFSNTCSVFGLKTSVKKTTSFSMMKHSKSWRTSHI